MIHQEACERAGFDYVGLDRKGAVGLLGDAHALPFADATFPFVLSIAVLEHLRYPLRAIAEVARVLEPGGIFLGTVAFLEPWHSASYYHHSLLGASNTLATAGLEVDFVAPSDTWSVVDAVTQMQRLPVTGKPFRWALSGAARAQRRVWRLLSLLRQGNRSRWERYVAHTTGAVVFRARRPR
jgi:SAM-dependent methyltransferase